MLACFWSFSEWFRSQQCVKVLLSVSILMFILLMVSRVKVVHQKVPAQPAFIKGRWSRWSTLLQSTSASDICDQTDSGDWNCWIPVACCSIKQRNSALQWSTSVPAFRSSTLCNDHLSQHFQDEKEKHASSSNGVLPKGSTPFPELAHKYKCIIF